ncbi:HCP-like protein [Backusella circina FSU 941]|nr:HCP-like protein [Backusella circina FSU 941]
MYNNNYNNPSSYYQQNSFEYVTPNSRIIPEPPTHEYNAHHSTDFRQPTRFSSLQHVFERESVIDPKCPAFLNDEYLEPNVASTEFPKSPVPNMSFFHQQHENNLSVPMNDVQIKMMNPPTPVRACVHIIDSDDMTSAHQAHLVATPTFSDTPSPSISESVGASFMLQPVPLHKKVSTKQTIPNPTRTSSIQKLPKPPLTPLVIPPTPNRTTSSSASSSPLSINMTPTRTSSIQHHQQQLTPATLTPSSTYSPHSPLTSSPLTPNNATMIPPVNSHNNNKTKSMLPGGAEYHVLEGIKFHELGQLEQATEQFRLASDLDLPIGMFLYGISLRHGWGCKKSEHSAFQYLQKAAEAAVTDLNNFSSTVNLSASKGELIMAIYELGVSFRHGWGCKKNKETALYFFKIAADLGDADAQNDLAHCYHNGHGTKKDIFMAAKYYRLADKQGHGIMGNSWIWKSKYDKP